MKKVKELVKQKLNSEKGFTLAEVLLAVLILLMVSAIVVAGIPAARDAYEKVVLTSNAQVTLSTTINTLRNELGTAKNIQTSGNEISYINLTRGSASRIYINSTGSHEIMLDRYSTNTEIANKGTDFVQSISLSSTPAAKDMNLYVTYESVNYNAGIVTFHNISVNSDTGKTGLATLDDLLIRVLSEG